MQELKDITVAGATNGFVVSYGAETLLFLDAAGVVVFLGKYLRAWEEGNKIGVDEAVERDFPVEKPL